PTQQLMLETYVITKEGKVRSHKKGKAHSYTIAYLQHLEVATNHQIQGTGGYVYIKDTTGTLQTCSCGSTGNYLRDFIACGAPATTTTYGILVGTGTAAVTCADYKMQTLIANGSSSGQL